jgi:hypothetical protein
MKKAFIGIIFVVVLICCLLATEFAFENFVGEFEELEQVKTSLDAGVEIIYFGDSVLKTSAGEGIEKMLSQESGKSVRVIAHEAYHLGVYAGMVNFISKQDKKPEVLVVPINLRSFSPEWDTRPQYQFTNEITKLNESDDLLIGLGVRTNNLFGNSDEKKLLDDIGWKSQTVYFGTEVVGTVNDFEFPINGNEDNLGELVKKKFIYQYGYILDEGSAKVQSLKDLIVKNKEMGVKVIVYVTPIDFEKGNEFVGADLLEIVGDNVSLLKKVGEDVGVEIIDLSFDLEHEKFNYSFIPNEHLKEEGLQYVAKKIAEEIQ